jgi:hypothetical protein
MTKQRSFVAFATVVLGLSALSFVSAAEARDRPSAPDAHPQPDAPKSAAPLVEGGSGAPATGGPSVKVYDIDGNVVAHIQPLVPGPVPDIRQNDLARIPK